VSTAPGARPEDQQDCLVDRLLALVAAAEAKQWSRHRLDQAVSRWSREVATPSDVLTLVAVARRRRGAAPDDELLDQVLHAGVTAVAQRLVREALTDSLTGLATRARLEEEAQRLIAVAARTRSPLTAVMIDVDGLKRINDEQGHHAGDEAIAEVGRAVREHTRKSDRAFRWGGDEFVVFMPGTTADQARVVVDRVQRSCRTAITAGVAAHSGTARDTDLAGWLKRADAAMYQRRETARAQHPPVQADRVRRPARHGRRPGLTGAALAVLVATVASGAGWVGATQVVPTLGTGQAQPEASPTTQPSLAPQPARQVVPTGRPTAVPVEQPRPTTTVVVVERETVQLPTSPTPLPEVPQVVPTSLPTAGPSVLPTEPPSVVGGLLDAVGHLLDGLG